MMVGIRGFAQWMDTATDSRKTTKVAPTAKGEGVTFDVTAAKPLQERPHPAGSGQAV